MKFLGFRAPIGVVVVAALLAGCTGHSAVIPTQPAPLTSGIETGNHAVINVADLLPHGCGQPKKAKFCVKAGGMFKTSITLSCDIDGFPVSCGTVSWSKRVNYNLVNASFSPNPGNPTEIKITAAKNAKAGVYALVIRVDCRGGSHPCRTNELHGTIRVTP